MVITEDVSEVMTEEVHKSKLQTVSPEIETIKFQEKSIITCFLLTSNCFLTEVNDKQFGATRQNGVIMVFFYNLF